MRLLLAVAALVFVAGCAAPAAQARDTVSIAAGGYVAQPLSPTGNQLVTADWSANYAVDVFLLTPPNFDSFKAGQQFIYVCADEASRDGGLSCNVSPGNYFLVFDNTSAGATQPVSDTILSYVIGLG